MNIKMLKDMDGSPDGAYIHTFHKDEVYAIGVWPMTQALADVFMAVPGAAVEEEAKGAAEETSESTTAERAAAQAAQEAAAAREAEQAHLDAEAAAEKALAAKAPGPSETKVTPEDRGPTAAPTPIVNPPLEPDGGPTAAPTPIVNPPEPPTAAG